MKRTISLALALVLLLCLLPATVYAGGGGAARIWNEDFNTDIEDWVAIDGNNDGYGFVWNSEHCCVQSGGIVGMGLLPPEPQDGYDYLISPRISLREDEDVLSYDVRVVGGNPDVRYDLFVAVNGMILDQTENVPVLRNPVYGDSGYSFLGGDWFTRTLDLSAYEGNQVQLVFRLQSKTGGGTMELDNLSIYWNEPDEILDKVTAFDVPEPRIGRKVSDCDWSSIVLPDTANYELVPNSLRYYYIEDELVRPFDGTFQPQGEYTLSFEVKAKSGNTVSESGIASVNGKWARFISSDSDVVRVEAYFSRLPNALDAVDVTVTPPLAGRVPVWEEGHTADPAKCTLLDHAFLELKDNGDPSGELPEGKAFELNKRYRIAVLLSPAEGWGFSEQTQVTINGLPAQMNMTLEQEGLQVYSVDVTVDHVAFTDVLGSQWYANAVLYCYQHGYLAGTGAYTFSPDADFTRAMFVTVLAKIDGADLSGYTGSSFTDVPADTWYSKPVEWAFRNGYTSGTGDGLFSPNMPLTRETLATFLYSYTKKAYAPGLDDEDWADLSAYPDGDQVSAWASNAVRWAVYHGFINGVPADGQVWLRPNAAATRAQVAQIIMKYCKYMENSYWAEN